MAAPSHAIAGRLLPVTGAQTTTYAYDALGNLHQVALPDGTSVSYRIDGEGNRIERADEHRALALRRAGRIVAELDVANALVSLYVYATTANTPDLMLGDGTAYRIVTDQLGSVRLVVDAATGTVMHQLDYDPFGKVLWDSNPGFQPFGFAGGLYDPATGLVRFGARDYDPDAGRWTPKDPIGFAGGYTSLYSYVGSDPVNFGDPSGLGPPSPGLQRYLNAIRTGRTRPSCATNPQRSGGVGVIIGIKAPRAEIVRPGVGTIPASIGDPTFIGDVIRTGPDTLVDTEFHAGGRVHVNRGTQAEVINESDARTLYDSWTDRAQATASRIYNKMGKRTDTLEIETNGMGCRGCSSITARPSPAPQSATLRLHLRLNPRRVIVAPGLLLA